MNIANDHLQEFIGTTAHHEYLVGNLLTDGVVALAEKFKCYWFLDIICSYTELLHDHEFQVWTLHKSSDASAIVKCTDGNDNMLIQQEISYTDFSADMAIVWKEGNVLLIPSEH